MKKITILATLSILTIFSSLFFYLQYPYFFSQFEDKITDTMFLARGKNKSDNNIIIIDIDEKSLKKLGQWPWSRNVIAKILQNLTDYSVGMIGLDVLFAEPDRSSPARILKKLGIDNKNIDDFDKILAKTIKNTPTITGYVFSLKNDGLKPGNSPALNAIIIERNRPKKPYFIKAYRAILNIPEIRSSAFSSGYFNTIPDSDGIVRSIPMLIDYKGTLYPSLSLEMIRNAMQEKKIVINYGKNSIESISIGGLNIPTDLHGRMLINYRGGERSYRYISAVDIYDKSIDKSLIKNKIALLGTSAAGLLDLRSTPFDAAYPGVEIHANAIDNMINQNFISKPVWSRGVDIISIVVLVLIVFGILLIPNVLLSIVFLILLNFIIFYLHYYMLFSKGILLNTLFPIISINLLFFIGTAINFFFANRQKNLIKSKFAKKVSSAVVDELLKNSNKAILGEERMITIFFSDIRDFTKISEKSKSAKELISFLNNYMTPMTDIITKHKGTVDKFIGDSIMAYWNAPIDIKLHADEALRTSIEQIQKLKKLNSELAKKKKPIIDIGIGLNSGKSIVGEMGSSGRSDYTCIGDAVNLASRAEGLCKIYGAKIILTQYTRELLQKEDYLIRELDIVRVKGKEKSVVIFECMGDSHYSWVQFDEDDIKRYDKALELYRKSSFHEAAYLFEKLNDKNKQTIYKLYINRCQHFMKNPPKDFDGVFTFKIK